MSIIIAIALLVVLLSLLQLMSFYCTSLRISGSPVILKTPCKRFVDGCFWVCVSALGAILTAYLSLVTVWFILGAILNPNEFLAYGTAAVTFYAFLVSKLTHFKKFYAKVLESAAKFAAKAMRATASNSLRRIHREASPHNQERLLFQKRRLMEQVERAITGEVSLVTVDSLVLGGQA